MKKLATHAFWSVQSILVPADDLCKKGQEVETLRITLEVDLEDYLGQERRCRYRLVDDLLDLIDSIDDEYGPETDLNDLK